METESVSHLDIVSITNRKFHILNENIPYQAEISLLIFFKSYTVKVNNNTYTVAISNPLDILIKKMGFETEFTKQSILSKHLCRD
jgi:hypothetical protein